MSETVRSTSDDQPSTCRLIATVALAGLAAVAAMLTVGWAFNGVEWAMPGIAAEYSNASGFRDWPGWTKRYMLIHPMWFGFVFAIGFTIFTRGRRAATWKSAWLRGMGFGVFLFVTGSLPIITLIYASFEVSLELLTISWAARNLVQYVVAGAIVAAVTQATTTR